MKSEWPVVPLGQVSVCFDSQRIPVKEADRKPGPYPYYGASGVVGYVHDYIFDGEYLLVAEDGENLRTRKLPVAFMATGKFWVNNHAHILQGNEFARTRYLCYALQVCDLGGYLSGSTMPKLTRANLDRIPVPLPPISAQDRIVSTLAMLDTRLEVLDQINTTLERLAGAMFKSWFINFDPVRAKSEGREPEGMDAETAALFPSEFQESELGPIPRGWRLDSIGYVVSCVGGGTPSTREPAYWSPGKYHWVTPKDLANRDTPVLLATDRLISELGLRKISSGLLPEGTLLMSSRAPIGYLAITKIPTAINQGFIAMLPGGQLPPEYLLFWARHNLDSIRQRANGSTFPEISKAAFRQIKIVIPPAELVTRFTEIVRMLLDKIAGNEHYRGQLFDLRDTLLPRLISGKLRVPEAEEALKEVL